MELLNIPPSYPLKVTENWRTLIMESESGIEQRASRWLYPKRQWDLQWTLAIRTTETDVIRNFLARHKGGTSSFLWKEPYKTRRDHVKLGYGDGSRTAWLVPVYDCSTLTFYVNSVETIALSVNSTGGQNSLGIVTFDTAPGIELPIDVSYIDGYYVPIVRLADQFSFTLTKPIDYGDIVFSLTETKEDYPTG